jgi:hypothetical protein
MDPSMRETMAFTVNAPVDRVFDFVADFEAATPVLSPGTRITGRSPGPVGLGTVFHYANDRFGIVGRTEVVQFAPPHTIGVTTTANDLGPFTNVTVVEAADAGGSTVRIYSNAKPFIPTRWLRPFAWMFGPLLRRPLANVNARYAEFARQTLEVQLPDAGGGSG